MVQIIRVTVIFERNKSEEYRVKVNENDTVKVLRLELSKLCGIPVHRLVIAEIFHKKVYCIYSDVSLVNRIKEHETIFGYELSPADVKSEEFIEHGSYEKGLTPFAELSLVWVEHREVSYYTYFGPKKDIEAYTREISPFPFLMYAPNGRFSAKELYDRCFVEIRKYVTEEGKELLLKHGINLTTSNRATLFPNVSREQEERFISKNFAQEEEEKKEEQLSKENEEYPDSFFEIKLYNKAMNYHSSKRGKKILKLYYTEHQPIQVEVVRLSSSRGLYTYYSPIRDTYWIKMEVVLGKGYVKCFDFQNPHFEVDLVDDDVKERLMDFFENVVTYCLPGSLFSVSVSEGVSVVCEFVPKFLFLK